MRKIKIPTTLPTTDFINILAEKADRRKDITFNFLGQLDGFRDRVSKEIRFINVLFPEYTPHDEEYHIKHLFNIADKLLGSELLQSMNSAELFILACALYGHDWGMAVSVPEKKYIVTGASTGCDTEPDIDLWEKDRERFITYVAANKINIDINGSTADIDINVWRSYVRATHAERSARRVNKYFRNIDLGVAESVSRVCVGHWLDLSKLHDPDIYQTNFSVLSETVNLRACAIYVRLVDLLDLANDRTPYIIWKFVAPSDPVAIKEWAKHRAIQPITCPSYFEGRVVKIDGGTDDHEVFASIKDLQNYCETQFRGCMDLLALTHDPRHKLDIHHLDWHIVARGFEPISIQFEFDRENTFRMLSDEIYSGDCYVFLRELLQNSIDAIRLRREIIKRKSGGELQGLGVIKVTIKHAENGDATIIWQDDGIGMDEYIVRNYLAIAGKSYYHSPDFDREQLSMNPISRFGIGLLSCFTVCDYIEIETYKDPYMQSGSIPLKIAIPSITRQFRVERLTPESAKIGTSIKVLVRGNKIAEHWNSDDKIELDVTSYLSTIAGFVEFPIIIEEGEIKTIIIHPRQDKSAIANRFGNEYNIKQLNTQYSWSDCIYPQDIQTAQKLFLENNYDICLDLGMKNVEGVLSCLVPNDETCVLQSYHESWTEVMKHKSPELTDKRVRWFLGKRPGVQNSPSTQTQLDISFYMDGILLSDMPRPIAPRSRAQQSTFRRKTVRCNITNSASAKMDLARTHITGQDTDWKAEFDRLYCENVINSNIGKLNEFEPPQRLHKLAYLVAYYNLDPDTVIKSVSNDLVPLLFIESGAKISTKCRTEFDDAVCYSAPEIHDYSDIFGEYISAFYKELDEYYFGSNIGSNWEGDPFVYIYDHLFSGQSDLIKSISDLNKAFLNRYYRPDGMRFLIPPWNGPPQAMEQVIWYSRTPDNKKSPPSHLTDLLESFRTAKLRTFTSEKPFVFLFLKPFENHFAYGKRTMNVGHSFTQYLIRTALLIESLHETDRLSGAMVGLLQDSWNDVLSNSPTQYRYKDSDFEIWQKSLYDLNTLIIKNSLMDSKSLCSKVPCLNEFIPDSLNDTGVSNHDKKKKFGKIIQSI